MTKQITKLYWGYNHKKQEREYITGEEFIRRLEPLITDPVESMWEMDGDMLMSDYQKLCTAKCRIRNAIEMLDKEGDV